MSPEKIVQTDQELIFLDSISQLTHKDFPTEIQELAKEFLTNYHEGRIKFRTSSTIYNIRVQQTSGKDLLVLSIPENYPDLLEKEDEDISLIKTIFETLMITREYSGPSMYQFKEKEQKLLQSVFLQKSS